MFMLLKFPPMSWSTKIAWLRSGFRWRNWKIPRSTWLPKRCFDWSSLEYKFLMLFFSKMNFIFKASAFLWDKMYHSQHLKAEALRKIKIITKQRQGNTRKTHFYTWRKHNQGNTRSYLPQRLVGYLSVKKCSSWQAKASTRVLIVLIKKRN